MNEARCGRMCSPVPPGTQQKEREIMSIFGSGKYSTLRPAPGKRHMVIPDGSWVKCKKCNQTLYTDRLRDNLLVCWNCNHHLAMTADERIALLTDAGSFTEIGGEVRSCDALRFVDSKPYSQRLADSAAKTGMTEAVKCGQATLEGHPLVLGAMDFRFMGASMGSAVGERITLAAEHATARKLPLLLVTASGGARMQEGILSLMQMAKTSAALERHAEAGLPYFVVLTDPTYGGVSASFATLGDVILAEPEAMIGFAGPRVIQETTKAKLPPGFQTAEFLLEKGLIDRVVERKKLRKEIALLLEFFHKAG